MNNKIEELSFLGHLEVLRWHLVRSIIAIMIFSILSFVFKDIVFDRILLAPKESDFLTYRVISNLSDLIGVRDVNFEYLDGWRLNSFTMAGQFSAHLLISLCVGFVAAFPYVFWEIWRFVKPALYSKENKAAKRAVFFTSILFSLGVLFGYYLVVPLSINFLYSYSVSTEVSNTIGLISFVSTVTTISLVNGMIFQLPILVYFLTKIGLVTPAFMKRYRKHAMVLILILAAIITPPDVISQVLVAFPVLVLYEISIRISKKVLKKKE